MNNPLLKLSQRIGYSFRDESLITLALTHRSKSGINNERLEFLGDSILNFVIADALFKKFENAKEGKLSRLRARLVKGVTLALIAKDFDLGEFLLLGSGELKSGGHRRESILADVVEAIIGAMYLDAGLEVTRERILAWYATRIDALTLEDPIKDPKTRLQEYQQGEQLGLPKYDVIDVSGPGNDQVFTVSCRIPQVNKEVKASGSSRRNAEQAAAVLLLSKLGLEEENS